VCVFHDLLLALPGSPTEDCIKLCHAYIHRYSAIVQKSSRLVRFPFCKDVGESPSHRQREWEQFRHGATIHARPNILGRPERVNGSLSSESSSEEGLGDLCGGTDISNILLGDDEDVREPVLLATAFAFIRVFLLDTTIPNMSRTAHAIARIPPFIPFDSTKKRLGSKTALNPVMVGVSKSQLSFFYYKCRFK